MSDGIFRGVHLQMNDMAMAHNVTVKYHFYLCIQCWMVKYQFALFNFAALINHNQMNMNINIVNRNSHIHNSMEIDHEMVDQPLVEAHSKQ